MLSFERANVEQLQQQVSGVNRTKELRDLNVGKTWNFIKYKMQKVPGACIARNGESSGKEGRQTGAQCKGY